MKLKCPACRREYEYIDDERNPYFPFCSQRCRLIDLGKWLGGDYAVSTPLKDADPDEK
jgi:endogenous inhibitor of DNA gyrase (YacG/DUF329 family)